MNSFFWIFFLQIIFSLVFMIQRLFGRVIIIMMEQKNCENKCFENNFFLEKKS